MSYDDSHEPDAGGGSSPATAGRDWSRTDVGILFTASTASRLAQSATGVSSVLFLLDRLDSPAAVGAVVAARSFPSLVVGPFTGAWLDRTRHRRASFLVSQTLLLVTLVGLLVLAGRVPLWTLLALGVLSGLTGPVLTAGFTGLIQPLVPERLLRKAFGFEAASYNVAGVAGPALAGLLVALTSPATAMAATCGLVLVALLALVPLRNGTPPAAPDTTLTEAVREGAGHLWRSRPLRYITLATTIQMAGYGATPVAYPLLTSAIGGSPASAGILFSTGALGALVGSLTTAARGSRTDPARTVAAGLAGLALVFAALAAAPSLPVAIALTVLAGLCGGPVLAATLTSRSQHSPDRLRTQVVVTAASLKGGGFALGSALTGGIAATAGPRVAVLTVSALMLLAALTALPAARSRPAASQPKLESPAAV